MIGTRSTGRRPRFPFLRPLQAGALAVLLPALAALLLVRPSAAESRAIGGMVLRARGTRVLVVADSNALVMGSRLTFVEKRRTLATGFVTGLMQDAVASVTLDSGSLDRVKKLDRVRMLADAPAPPPATISRLAVGLPANGRANLAVACRECSPEAPPGYRIERPAGGTTLMLREGADKTPPGSPDTLSVRLFRDAADEEIAFERGEIDVAVFWPGEPSAHLRADPRGNAVLLGLRSRGALAVVETRGGTVDTSRAAALDPGYASLNAQLFGGDLLEWNPVSRVSGSAVAPGGARDYFVDSALPGQQLLLRHLTRFARAGVTPRTVSRLSYIDASLASRDSLETSWRAAGLVPVYALRCPVFVRPEARRAVEAIGAGRFADLFACPERER